MNLLDVKENTMKKETKYMLRHPIETIMAWLILYYS